MFNASNYGAVCTKIRALYSKRITSEEFVKLASMPNVTMIFQFLCSHPGFAEELENVEENNAHRGILEQHLKNVLFEEYYKISHFIKLKDKEVYEYPVLSNEIDIVLAFVRRLNAGELQNFNLYLSNHIKSKLKIDFDLLTNAVNYEQMTEAFIKCDFYKTLPRFAKENGERIDYTALEIALSGFYFNHLYSAINKAYKGKIKLSLSSSVEANVELTNIARTLRLKRFFTETNDEFFMCLIPLDKKINREFYKKLFACKSNSEETDLLSKSKYGKHIKSINHKYFEQYVDYYLYNFYNSIIRSPPSVFVPIAYLAVKEIEVHNLIHIIEGVRYSLPPDKILDDIIGKNLR